MSDPQKGKADWLDLGSWNAVCYECGRKFKANQLKRHWQGYYVCPAHWEPRQPQDFVRGVQDVQTPPWTQPMPSDVFVPFNWSKEFNEPLYVYEDIQISVNFALNIPISTAIIDPSELNAMVLNGAEVNGPLELSSGSAIENPRVTEIFGSAANKNPADTSSTTETVAKSVGTFKSDAAASSETVAFGFGANKSDTATSSETFIKTIGAVKSDTATTSESVVTALTIVDLGMINASALNDVVVNGP